MIYIKQTYNVRSVKKPHFFIGSKIRGALGYPLKEEVCINPAFACKDCFALKDCIFYKFYEQQNVLHDYRLDFKLKSQKYKFSILLFNDAIKHKDSIKKATLKSLQEHEDISKEKTKTLKLKKYNSIIKLEFLTPLRMKKGNRLLRDTVDLLDILVSINKRYCDLTKQPYRRLEIEQNYKLISTNLYYQELTRKSNKQNIEMYLGGLMGEMVISNVNKQVYDLLKIGEVIGVGKSTAFGLGKIRVKDIR